MYTLVLMTAMTSAPDTAEFNGFFRRLFSFGGCSGSCTGSGYGCTGSRLRAYTGCCGCTGRGYGSCTGAALSAGSCTGSGYLPCSGGVSYSCTGGLMTAPLGADPGGYAIPAPAVSNFYYPSFYPMTDAGGCWGGRPTPTLPPMGVPAPGLGQPFAPTSPAVPEASVPDSRNTSFAHAPAGGRATVVVKLPADAVLYAEGRRLTLGGTERTFTTPPLPAGDWGYTFRAEYTRDGETISRSKRVGVRPGDALVLEFTETGLARTTKADPPKPMPSGLATAAVPTVAPPPVPPLPALAPAADRPEPATLTIKLPPGATLTVDGKRLDRGGQFRTPPLAPGREYTYQMQTEQVKDGQPVRAATKVSFRAGELVTVDLTTPPVK